MLNFVIRYFFSTNVQEPRRCIRPFFPTMIGEIRIRPERFQAVVVFTSHSTDYGIGYGPDGYRLAAKPHSTPLESGQ